MTFDNVLILGDSYSTFTGYIPKDYDSWYWAGGHDATDVVSVNQTWWVQLCEETNSRLLLNCSWSGTTICNTGYDQADCSAISFIARFDKLIQQNCFIENKIDTLFIFGGTNDSWAGSPIGTLQYENWTKENLFSVLPAFCYLLSQAKKHLPMANIVVIINTELNDAITDGFQTACKEMGISYVRLHDISKQNGHPNVLGMTQIKNQIIETLSK